MKNLKGRIKVCNLQLSAVDRGRPLNDGVRVKDEDGNPMTLNAVPRTNWLKEKQKAQAALRAR